jgi:starvation-inducible DNA-binding protein
MKTRNGKHGSSSRHPGSQSDQDGGGDRRSEMGARSSRGAARESEPLMPQRGREIQRYGSVIHMPIALDEQARKASADSLNQILADTMTLRDLYKKHHWQVSGHTFYQLHLLFDKHYEEQAELVDAIAERIQLLGGLAIAMAPDIAELTRIERPPRGREEVPVQISRLLEAHELILKEVREAAEKASDAGDEGTNDLLISEVLRTNELQVWFVAEHVVDTPLVKAD